MTNMNNDSFSNEKLEKMQTIMSNAQNLLKDMKGLNLPGMSNLFGN